jgi:hypothetical protein
VLLDPYRFALRDGVPLARLRASWTWQLLQAAWKAADPLRLAPALASLAGGGEGSGALVRWERRLGRLRGLWRFRRGYGARVEAVREAPWRRRPGERAGTGE